MNFSSIEQLADFGFYGFKNISTLWQNKNLIPNTKGVYCVVNPTPEKAEFLFPGVGGFFNGKNPNVDFETLKQNWIQNCPVIYIGKAGGSSNATLRSRLTQYLRFGQGANVGHWGGRYIWQLKNHRDLLVCWFETPMHNPRDLEIKLLELFKEQFNNRLPFANLSM